MRYRLRDLASMLRTPVGRRQFIIGVRYRAWPVIWRLTMLYRQAVIGKTCVIPVVGSFGKTSTTRAILAALDGTAPENPNPNSYGGVALKLLGTRLSDRYCVIEVGIDGTGQMVQYARMLRPDIAVVTSIGSEHNRSLRSLEVTRAEKSEMIKALRQSGTAVINGDDPNVCWMIPHTKAAIIKFGLSNTNDIWASDIKLDWPRGTVFRLHVNGEIHDLKIRLLGKIGVYAILAAVAVSQAAGLALGNVLPRLESLSPTPGRLEPVHLNSGVIILRDDYKSTLETIDPALDLLAEIPAQRKIAILGEVSEPPGSQGPIYHRIGERIAGIASKAIFIGGNYQRYATGALRGGLPKSNLVNAGRYVLNAIELIKADLIPGDVLLVKGRSEQRLDRISLALMGRKVSCHIDSCKAAVRCAKCPMLETGWDRLKVVI